MIRKVLVANRGEIAVRIMRACREMGLAAVAAYSEADKDALFVKYADEAFLLGPAPARASYLNIEKVIDIAKLCGADAGTTSRGEGLPVVARLRVRGHRERGDRTRREDHGNNAER